MSLFDRSFTTLKDTSRTWSMSDSDSTDEALQRLRETFEHAADEAEQMGETARKEVEDAIDDLEERIDQIRNRD